MNGTLKIGLPKGRLYEQASGLLARCGLFSGNGDSRRLIIPDDANSITFVLLKPVDIPVYVESGALDAGIAGTDILREQQSEVYEPLDLRIGRCQLALAVRSGVQLVSHPRIGTKYPRTTLRYFSKQNKHVQIVKLEGSVEIAPLLGLADAIVDLVETGRTLRENGLEIIENIEGVTSKLIVNKTSMKVKAGNINQLIEKLDAVIYENT